jgi:hypothetical protein
MRPDEEVMMVVEGVINEAAALTEQISRLTPPICAGPQPTSWP